MTARVTLDSVTLTVLCENTVGRSPGLIGEWGLSVWIEAGDRCVLLDAGEAAACVGNAAKLGVDLARAEAVVVSHGHFNHTGGLARALPLMPKARIYLHEDASLHRYATVSDIQVNPDNLPDIGMPEASRAALASRGVVTADGPLEVVPGVWVTGPIPREEAVEGRGGSGWLDRARTRPDTIRDDMAVWIETAAGVLVVLGCAHAGLINTVRLVQRHAEGAPIVGVVGGTHLRQTSAERMKTTLGFLGSLALQLLAPCHCTGAPEAFELRKAFPRQFTGMTVGDVIHFPA